MLDAAWNGPHPVPPPKLGEGEGEGKVNVMTLVAWGGVGKSALVNKWLTQMARDNYRGAERVYGWSFYSQGAAEGRQVSADQFIAAALAWFGDPDPNARFTLGQGRATGGTGQAAAHAAHPRWTRAAAKSAAGRDGQASKTPRCVALLRELARQNPGLVVITTRLAVDDLKDFYVRTCRAKLRGWARRIRAGRP